MDIYSFVIVEKQKRILLIKEVNKKWKGQWFFPGGKKEKNEKIEECAIRETIEEAGLKIKVNGIFFVSCEKKRSIVKQHTLKLFLSARKTGGKLKTYATKESLEAAWFDYNKLKELNLRDNALEIIEYYFKTNQPLPVDHFILKTN